MNLSVFNLNIMHGRNRRSALLPLWLGRKEVQHNLRTIAACIREHDPDIVTLQEVDQFSIFSGSFDQFEFLKRELGYRDAYFAASCSIKGFFVSGNAIFSKYPLENCVSVKFDISFPTDRMGFAIADIKLPEGKTVAVVSIHLTWLDLIRPHSRSRQLRLVQKVLDDRKRASVIAGDFNCDLTGDEESLIHFVHRLGLRTYEPESRAFSTYPAWRPARRIDWILIFREIDLLSYKTISREISDHLAVFAELSQPHA